ncbi:alpha-ketoacid dehydrogenase subunit beta [Variovorax saccharolyticus]|uniref:alpha-ketoacid dehydrogenase subunit beta n=1 Tax=Variovorax saccharolyticus TaxID=3053516 RepID=UPI002575D4B8|nr:transketolase C-terminal domain-containing protein [Variovorax sp. J31P216]MDM0025585.1 transketolase C-terminal domain-containing protein [Variovorax sp. J31P216]
MNAVVDTLTLSYAQAAAVALTEAMEADPNVVALGEDLGRGGVFGQYRSPEGQSLAARFGPERVIDTPISEAAIVGASVGMALAGLRPVVELRVVDFALCAIDELVNQAAKNRFMFGGQGRIPLVARMPIGLWGSSAAQHSQSLEAWFAHIPGLVVVAPSTPADNYGLLHAALESGDPVVYMEHKELWGSTGPVALGSRVELGKARIAHPGCDLSIVSWSRQVHACVEAAKQLADQGIGAEVIDLRTLWPWDRDAVLASAARTGRVLVVHEAVQVAGFGAEIAATVAEHSGARVGRLGAPRIPVGYAPVLEDESRIGAAKVLKAAHALLQR